VIVVDSSAIMAILLGEARAAACIAALEAQGDALISAGTLAELFIISGSRDIGSDAAALISRLRIEIVSVSEATARQIGDAYSRWGKGIHPAGLNFGDCFAYALAKERGCPLLYVGNDFSKTDIKSAL
jgi:ribonuclease VapC